MPDQDEQLETEPMHHREITLPDGRYMIFYTFGDSEQATQEENDQGEHV